MKEKLPGKLGDAEVRASPTGHFTMADVLATSTSKP